jgi:hypothetical protein
MRENGFSIDPDGSLVDFAGYSRQNSPTSWIYSSTGRRRAAFRSDCLRFA